MKPALILIQEKTTSGSRPALVAPPKIFFKIMQFSGNFRGNPYILSTFGLRTPPPHWGQNSAGPPDQNPGCATAKQLQTQQMVKVAICTLFSFGALIFQKVISKITSCFIKPWIHSVKRCIQTVNTDCDETQRFTIWMLCDIKIAFCCRNKNQVL